MPHYSPTTGHQTNPAAHLFDDVDDTPTPTRLEKKLYQALREVSNAANCLAASDPTNQDYWFAKQRAVDEAIAAYRARYLKG